MKQGEKKGATMSRSKNEMQMVLAFMDMLQAALGDDVAIIAGIDGWPEDEEDEEEE